MKATKRCSAAHPGTYLYAVAELPHEAHCAAGDDDCVLFIAFVDPIDAIPIEES